MQNPVAPTRLPYEDPRTDFTQVLAGETLPAHHIRVNGNTTHYVVHQGDSALRVVLYLRSFGMNWSVKSVRHGLARDHTWNTKHVMVASDAIGLSDLEPAFLSRGPGAVVRRRVLTCRCKVCLAQTDGHGATSHHAAIGL